MKMISIYPTLESSINLSGKKTPHEIPHHENSKELAHAMFNK